MQTARIALGITPCRIALLAGLAAALLLAGAASATPETYRIKGGSIIVTASSGGSFLWDPVELGVAGDSIEVDLAAGSEELISLSIASSGSTSVALTPPIGGYETLFAESLSLTGGPGTLIPIGAAGSDFEYFALIEDLVLSTSFAAVDGDGVLVDLPISLTVPLGTGTGQVFASLTGDDLTLTGFALSDFLLPGFDSPISIKVDFDVTAEVIPEPTGAVIFGLGLLPVSLAVRRARKSRS